MHSKTRTYTGFAGVASLVAPFAPRACGSSACESSTSARGQAVQSEVRAAARATRRAPGGEGTHTILARRRGSCCACGSLSTSAVRATSPPLHFGPKGLGTKAPERVPAGVRAHAQPTTQRHVLLCCAAVRAVGSRAVAPLHCMRPSILVVYIERP